MIKYRIDMGDPIEALTYDGDVVLLYVTKERILICDEDGHVLTDVTILPSYLSGLMYDQ